jgi:predicted DNA-binding transcriptional regulator AlpA
MLVSKLPSKLLRFKDLSCVSINNWPTLKRRVLNDNFPPGRYVGSSRVWTVEEVEEWWKARPSAAPPDNVIKPAAPVCSRSDGRDSNIPVVTPSNSELVESVQALHNGRGER